MTKRQEQAQETKRRLREAALSLFAEKDLLDTTIAEICRKAGVSVGNFYHYYTAKEDIITEAYQVLDEEFLKELENRTYENSSEALEALFCREIEAISRFGPRPCSQILQMQLRRVENADENVPGTDGFGRPYVCRLLAEARERGEFICGECTDEELAEKMRRMSYGLLFDWCVREGEFDILETARSEIRLFLSVFSGKAAKS